jgi:hypothetical protein
MRAAVVVIVMLAASLAHADDKTEAEALFRAGEKAFNAAQYQSAADAFEQAYGKLPLPAIAFSLAQAHRLQYFIDNQPAHLARAVKLYHLYIDEQKSGGRVPDAVANLAQIEPLVHQLEAAGAMRGGDTTTRTTRLVVMADVDKATASVDGPKDGKTGPTPFVIEVAPGEHTVTIAADGYQPYTVKATAIDHEMVPVEAQLVAKPAQVTVTAPKGARVAVDGRSYGTTPMGAFDLSAGKHLLTVLARGHVAFGKEISVTRGAALKLDARVPATTQRKVARYTLYAAGGATLLTGLVAISAFQADSDASSLHDRLVMGGQSAGDIARYNKLIDRRDQRVEGTEIVGGVTLAIAVTAFLLYRFDEPVLSAHF